MENYIALDFETTGLDPDRHSPITVGLCNDTHEIYMTLHPGSNGRFAVDAKAMEVNKLDIYDVIHYPAAALQDLALYAALKDDVEENGKFEAVGLNVGNFDMQFLRKALPNTYTLFGHRPYDLNTAFRTLVPSEEWKEVRDAHTNVAVTALDLTEDDLHDSFNDARVAWHVFSAIRANSDSPF